MKAGYHGSEGAAIRGYAKPNREFPHQPTSDRWFTESQFNSYRALGFEIMDDILCGVLVSADCAPAPGLASVFLALNDDGKERADFAVCITVVWSRPSGSTCRVPRNTS